MTKAEALLAIHAYANYKSKPTQPLEIPGVVKNRLIKLGYLVTDRYALCSNERPFVFITEAGREYIQKRKACSASTSKPCASQVKVPDSLAGYYQGLSVRGGKTACDAKRTKFSQGSLALGLGARPSIAYPLVEVKRTALLLGLSPKAFSTAL